MSAAKSARPAELRIQYRPLGELVAFEGNPKSHDLPTIRHLILSHGFNSPLLVDERSGRVVAGHGRLKVLRALQEEGADPPEHVLAGSGEWRVPVVPVTTFESLKQAKAFLIGDNRAVELGGWHQDLLADMLGELKDAGLLDLSGHTEHDYEALLASLRPPPEFPEYDETVPQKPRASVTCPHCGETFTP